MQNAEVTGCVAHAHYASALGGAVFARGGVYLSHSIVTDSHARTTGYASGGGVYALGSFTSKYSTIQRSYCYAETSTPSFAGGVFARGPVLMMGTTISDSNAIRDGGAAFDDSQGYDTTIINSTISHNNAGATGGMSVRPPLYLYNSTIANNNSNAWTDGAGHYFPGGVYIMVPGVIESSIIASNTSGGAPFATTDLLGAPGSGFNGGHSDVMFCGVPCPNDTAHDDPGLGPLQDNGGFNRTQVPTPGFWDIAGGTNERSVQWDQRGPGFPRQSSGDFPRSARSRSTRTSSSPTVSTDSARDEAHRARHARCAARRRGDHRVSSASAARVFGEAYDADCGNCLDSPETWGRASPRGKHSRRRTERPAIPHRALDGGVARRSRRSHPRVRGTIISPRSASASSSTSGNGSPCYAMSQTGAGRRSSDSRDIRAGRAKPIRSGERK